MRIAAPRPAFVVLAATLAAVLPMASCSASLPASGSASAPTRALAGEPWTRSDLVHLFAHWREGERRRDVAMAQAALHFADGADREHHARELHALEGVPAGPVCAPSELHLVRGPGGLGPGDYLFLEPGLGSYQAAFVTVVPTGDGPRLLYRRPDLTEEERRRLAPEDQMQVALRRRRAHWTGLRGPALQAEVERTRNMLAGLSEAGRYAVREGLALVPYHPDPAVLLREIEGLPAEEARARLLAHLGDGR